MTTEQEAMRELFLERRRAALVEVKAIEKVYLPSTVTITIRREEALRLGLIESPKT